MTVTLSMPCPACGHEATWCGTSTDVKGGGGATEYVIDCPDCPPGEASP